MQNPHGFRPVSSNFRRKTAPSLYNLMFLGSNQSPKPFRSWCFEVSCNCFLSVSGEFCKLLRYDTFSPMLPPNWAEHKDPTTGKAYYYNSVTKARSRVMSECEGWGGNCRSRRRRPGAGQLQALEPRLHQHPQVAPAHPRHRLGHRP